MSQLFSLLPSHRHNTYHCRAMNSTSRRDHHDGSSVAASERKRFFKPILKDTLREGKLEIPREFVKRFGRSLPSLVVLKVPTGAVWPVELSKRHGEFWFQKGWQDFAVYYSLEFGHLLFFEYDGSRHFHVIIFDNSATESTHFFRPILDDTLREGKLEIPREFVKRFGRSLPSLVILKVPTGAVWPVELAEGDGKFWFRKGWQNFAGYYSLEFGHLLVLEYDGSRHFHVIIFDKSATEIKYPCDNTVCSEDLKHAGDDTVCSEELKHAGEEQYPEVGCKARERSPLPFPFPNKKARNDSTVHRNSTSMSVPHSRPKQLTREVPHEVEVSCQKELGASTSGLRRPKTKVQQPLMYREIFEALQKANGFWSANPHFKMVMELSYVSTRFELAIPAEFGKMYMKKKRSDVYLCVSDWRIWPAKYSNHEFQSNPKIYDGWKKFVCDHCLRVGDVCVFELIEIDKIKLKVHIYQVDEDPNIHRLQGEKTSNKDIKASQGAGTFKSQNLCCRVFMHPSYIRRGGLRMPADFAKDYLPESRSDVTLCTPDGRSWSVEYNNRLLLPKGWLKFVHDNNLEVGDVCLFELIQSFEIKLNVFIIKSAAGSSYGKIERSPAPDTRRHKKKRSNSTSQTDSSSESDSHSIEICSQCSESETETTSHSSAQKFGEKEGGESSAGLRCPKSQFVERTQSWRSQEESEAFLRACAFQSKNPFCMIVMQLTYISRSTLEIPTRFGKKYLANLVGQNPIPIILCVPDGRTWSVNCHRYGKRPAVKFQSGWRKFVHDNRLKLGDVCVFELIEIKVIKVSIFRVDEGPTSEMSQGSGRRQQRTSTGKNNSNGGSSQRPTMKEEPL
ncbi:uncharacterized protein LOC119998720 isoform X3 [Tripterygium wilfordii]|uniref:uncharacterized protein LOC119998720 isoform X3 n=1 Tax=Tripterygium wilfordii TaxID=458696 RepID=UPI0018F7FBF6|nr:uncharacterized protein LOC119998720 isoform X3 [Tripterygium wilfordii]